MSFAEPPPGPYYPPRKDTVRKVVILIILITIIFIAIFLYNAYRQAYRTSCNKNSDCSGSTPACNPKGVCVACVRSTDCPKGTACSTDFTCVQV